MCTTLHHAGLHAQTEHKHLSPDIANADNGQILESGNMSQGTSVYNHVYHWHWKGRVEGEGTILMAVDLDSSPALSC